MHLWGYENKQNPQRHLVVNFCIKLNLFFSFLYSPVSNEFGLVFNSIKTEENIVSKPIQPQTNFTPDAAGRYQCQNCDTSFAQIYNLRTHIKAKHSEYIEKYKCLHCDAILALKDGVKAHVKRVHKDLFVWLSVFPFI